MPRHSTTRTWSPKKNDNAKPGEEAKRGVPRSQAKQTQARSDDAKPSEERRSEASGSGRAASCEGQADLMMTCEAGPSEQ